MYRKILVFALFYCLLTSCASKKNITYLRDIEKTGDNKSAGDYELKLKPDDLLFIIISAPDPEIANLAAPFNLPAVNVLTMADQSTTGGLRYQSFLIDKDGFIDFPVLGKIKFGGLKKSEAVEKLRTEISRYFKNPIINMRVNNFEVSVLGEVVRPGPIRLDSERITFIEALSQAGDLTIYGNRKNILLIRDTDGVKTYTRIDITKADFMSSPYYYLQQNDVIYVEPNQTRVNSSVIGPNLSVAISAVSLLVTIIALSIRN